MKKEGTAVITGATTGIGRAVAEALAAEGYALWVCARSEDKLTAMREHWAVHYPDRPLHTYAVDVSKKADVEAFAGHVKRATDQLDVLINNAGVFFPGSLIEEPDGQLEQIMATNLYSTYWLTRALIDRMLPYRSGHIFNMCSIASVTAYPNGGAYAISKHALLGFSRTLRAELKDRGIKVTSILPGATWSASWAWADFPEDRLMQASDVAEVILSALRMSPSAVVEEIVIRPQLGDL